MAPTAICNFSGWSAGFVKGNTCIKARLIFENSPIRVIFSQRQGMHVFHDDPAFAHLNQQHRAIIAALPRFHYVLDIQDEGLFYLYNRPTAGEMARFQTT